MSASPIIVDAFKRSIERDGLWVPFEVYRYNYGESQETVYTRRYRGIWQDGVHCKVIKGAGLWINLTAVNAWAADAKCESRGESRSDSTKKASPKASASPSCSAASSAAND